MGDTRVEGAILFDRADGLVRNDYVASIIFDDVDSTWKYIGCAFSQFPDDRGPTGLIVGQTKTNPLRGLHILPAALLNSAHLPDKHEDPDVLYDAEAKRWRLV